MATLYYGPHRINLPDEDARKLSEVIASIVREGATEWLPSAGALGEDDDAAFDLLITPGVPVFVHYDSTGDSLERLRDVLKRYTRSV